MSLKTAALRLSSVGIGTRTFPFRGTLDGQAHKIEGVCISKDSGDYPYYGFWLYMDGAVVRDLSVGGSMILDFADAAYPNACAGSVVAYAKSCKFEDCSSAFDIEYRRAATNNFTYEVNVGGFVAETEESELLRCEYDGDIKLYFGSGGRDSEFYDEYSYVTVGGLVANAGAIWTRDNSLPYIKICGDATAIGQIIRNGGAEFHVSDGHIVFEIPQEVSVWSLSGELLYVGDGKVTKSLPKGVCVLKVGGYCTKVLVK